MAEIEGREEEEDAKRCKEFETNNPEFCTQMIDDMKTRSEARWVVRLFFTGTSVTELRVIQLHQVSISLFVGCDFS